MTLVEIVIDAGLRGYLAAQAQQSQQSSALVTPLTAELPSLLPRGSYRAGHGRPARIRHWPLSSLPEPQECKEELALVIDPAHGSRHQGIAEYVR